MTEVDKQNEFTKSFIRLLTWLDLNGYQTAIGEVFRPPWVALAYSTQGRGIARSRHCDKMAVDLCVFKNGVLLLSVEDLRPVGEFWESLSVPELKHVWGGVWVEPDADHFSIADGNRA